MRHLTQTSLIPALTDSSRSTSQNVLISNASFDSFFKVNLIYPYTRIVYKSDINMFKRQAYIPDIRSCLQYNGDTFLYLLLMKMLRYLAMIRWIALIRCRWHGRQHYCICVFLYSMWKLLLLLVLLVLIIVSYQHSNTWLRHQTLPRYLSLPRHRA